MSSRHLQDMSSRRLQDVFKTCPQDVFRTCLQDVFKTSSRYVLKMSSRYVLKTSSRSLQDQQMFAGQFPNPLLLAIILHKKRRYGMLEYYQFWLENIRLQRYEVLINKIWGKKIQNGTSNFRIFVKHDSPRHRKMWFFNWDCLSYKRTL